MLRITLQGLVAGLFSSFVLAGCAPVQGLQNVAAAGGALANSVTATGEQTALSAVELRQLQTRDFTATKAAAFSSVVTVLLDTGYRVQSADLASGLITAAAPSTGRLRLDPAGVARATQTPLASAYVEERTPDTVRVRIAFSIGTTATGQLGSSGEKAVLDQSIYTSFFSRLEDEIQQRPTPANPPPLSPEPDARSPASGHEMSQSGTAEVLVGEPGQSDTENAGELMEKGPVN